jgi:response regulator RpfG family c-di-GMP phosphodiesterase
MMRLVITADDELYNRLSTKSAEQGDALCRARNVLDGYRMAATRSVDAIIVDLAVHAADTLVETLHSRPATSHIPLYVVECGAERLPFELRRLCTDVLEGDAL